MAGTELLDAVLSAFSFERENGTRIVGVAVFAILILFALTLRAIAQGSRITRELSAVLEGLAWERFRRDGHPERFRGKVAILIPAYNEAENIGHVLERIPARSAASRSPCWSSTTAPATAPAMWPRPPARSSPAT